MVAVAKEKLTIILILTLAFGQLVRIPLGFLGYDNIFVTPLDVASLLLFLFWILSKPNITRSKLSKPIIIFAAVCFLSLVINSQYLLPNELFASFLYLLRWFVLASVYFIVSDFDKKVKQKLKIILLFTGFATVLLGLTQYIFYPDLRNLYYAGWDEHLYRVFSIFLDPNFAGVFFVLTIILMMGMFYEKISKVWRVTISIGIILATAATLLTYSRSAFLTLFAATAIFLWLVNKKRLIVVFYLFFAVGIFLLPKNLPSEGVNLSRTASITARQQSMKKTIAIFKDNPLFGVGFNAYRYAQKRYGFLEETNWQTVHSGAGTDNSFLFVLATTGIIGFIAFANLLYAFVKNTLILQNTIFSRVVFVSIIAITIDSFFVNSLFYESILAWMWILVALMENK